jgi:hypothetical protein
MRSLTHSKPFGPSSGCIHALMTYIAAPVCCSHCLTVRRISPGSRSSTLLPISKWNVCRTVVWLTLPEPQVLDTRRGYPRWIAADLPCFGALRRSRTPPRADSPAQFVPRDYMRTFALLVPSKVQVGSWCQGFDWRNAV